MHDVLLFHEVGDRQRDAGIRGVADDVDLLGINPLPCDVNANVGLVLVVATDDVDLPALGDEAGSSSTAILTAATELGPPMSA